MHFIEEVWQISSMQDFFFFFFATLNVALTHGICMSFVNPCLAKMTYLREISQSVFAAC